MWCSTSWILTPHLRPHHPTFLCPLSLVLKCLQFTNHIINMILSLQSWNFLIVKSVCLWAINSETMSLGLCSVEKCRFSVLETILVCLSNKQQYTCSGGWTKWWKQDITLSKILCDNNGCLDNLLSEKVCI